MILGGKMSAKRSFTGVEKKLVHDFRNRMNNAENIVEVSNHFAYIVSKLLLEIFDGKDINISQNDVKFDPDEKCHHIVSNNLMNNDDFKQVWENSDLPDIITRFAKSAHKHYKHLAKHEEKTEKKIRDHK